ncbi:MAG: alpha/beta hydrolase [Saprospiraceae bacterium]|jgi:proline iminopeptidase|nr:alpha/beta hydrolase [Saprospiraceae bacterium]
MYKNVILFFAFYSLLMSSCTDDRDIKDSGNLVPKTVVEDPSLPTININGAKLHAQAFGHKDSTIIVILHGGPGGDFKYMLNCKSLADKGYRVVFYDQIGSGLSQRFPYEYYTKFEAEALNKVYYDELRGVINFYKQNAKQKVVILGDSWGGIMAVGYAGKYPNEIDGLIVGEPGGLKWADIETYVKNSIAFKFFGETLNDITFKDQIVSGKENQHEILDYQWGLTSAKNDIVGERTPDIGNNTVFYKNTRAGAVVYSAILANGEKYQVDFSAGIEQYKKKTLYIYSSENKSHTDSWAQKISSGIPNKELFKVQGVGHSGFFDQRNTWITITEPKVLQFLKSI